MRIKAGRGVRQGKTAEDAGLRSLPGLFLVSVERAEEGGGSGRRRRRHTEGVLFAQGAEYAGDGGAPAEETSSSVDARPLGGR